MLAYRRWTRIEAVLDLAEQPNACYRHQFRDAFPPSVAYGASTIALDDFKHDNHVILNFTRYAYSHLCPANATCLAIVSGVKLPHQDRRPRWSWEATEVRPLQRGIYRRIERELTGAALACPPQGEPVVSQAGPEARGVVIGEVGAG